MAARPCPFLEELGSASLNVAPKIDLCGSASNKMLTIKNLRCFVRVRKYNCLNIIALSSTETEGKNTTNNIVLGFLIWDLFFFFGGGRGN